MSGRFYVNLPANFVPIEGDKILRVFDYFNLPDELVELIPGQSFAHLGARADYVRHETTRKVPEPRLPPYSLRLDGLRPTGHTSQLHKHTRRLNTRTSPARFRASSSVKLVLVLYYTVWDGMACGAPAARGRARGVAGGVHDGVRLQCLFSGYDVTCSWTNFKQGRPSPTFW